MNHYQGRRLNSPERRGGEVRRFHLVHRSGVRHSRLLRGRKSRSELPPSVYRIDGQTGEASVVADDVEARTASRSRLTNRSLYVVASRAQPTRKIIAYDVVGGTRLANPRVFIDAGPGTPDGFRVDINGNLWCGWGMGDRGAGRRARVQRCRRADRPHRVARTLRQSVLRRALAQPAVHGGEPRPVRALCEHAGRARRLSRLSTTIVPQVQHPR